MNFGTIIQENFGIPLNHIKIYSQDKALCLIHVNWLKFITKGLKISPELLEEDLADENLVNFFSSSNDVQLNSEWKLLSIFLWKKRDEKVFRFLKPHEKSSSSAISLTYAQLIHYVTKANYKNLWEQAWKKYVAEEVKRNKNKQNCNDALQELLHRLYETERFKKEDGTIIHVCSQKKKFVDETEDAVNPNLLQVYCAIETAECFLLVCQHITCTLSDCLMFSPHLLAASTVHPLFVIYQLLQILRSVHNSGLFLGPITLSSINVKDNLWIKVFPLSWKYLHHEACNYPTEKHFTLSHKQSVFETNYASQVNSYSQDPPFEHQGSESSSLVNDIGNNLYLSELVQDWVDGNISNFDYLLSLNKLAGRQKNNAKCHYVMPWIMDFSVPEGGWRDLSKSKFRLNKGDKQLDLIYESAVEASGTNISYNSSNILQDSAITSPHTNRYPVLSLSSLSAAHKKLLVC